MLYVKEDKSIVLEDSYKVTNSSKGNYIVKDIMNNIQPQIVLQVPDCLYQFPH